MIKLAHFWKNQPNLTVILRFLFEFFSWPSFWNDFLKPEDKRFLNTRRFYSREDKSHDFQLMWSYEIPPAPAKFRFPGPGPGKFSVTSPGPGPARFGLPGPGPNQNPAPDRPLVFRSCNREIDGSNLPWTTKPWGERPWSSAKGSVEPMQPPGRLSQMNRKPLLRVQWVATLVVANKVWYRLP